MEKPHDDLEDQEDDAGSDEGDTVTTVAWSVRLGDVDAAAVGIWPLPCHCNPDGTVDYGAYPNRKRAP